MTFPGGNAPPTEDALEKRVLAKAAWRLLPFLGLLYILNILDRVNVGFARLTMQTDLGMGQAVFDLGFGLFYIGYLFFEVPSNLILHRVGARVWISRIMITWGMVSCATMFVQDVYSFYAIRILLGVAEAGFFPGIILYLTYWFPSRHRAAFISLFMIANPLASMFGNPLSGWILDTFQGTWGLKGWQWLFLLEGIPTVLIGFLCFKVLADKPQTASWLTPAERDCLVTALAREEESKKERRGIDLLFAMLEPRVWMLIALYFTVAVGANAAGAYVPKLIAERFVDLSKTKIGLLSAVPALCAVVGMLLFSYASDRTRERALFVSLAALLASAGWALCWQAVSPWIGLAGICLAQMGMMSMLPVFWTMPSKFFRGAAAAGGIALINSVANLGGFIGPWLLGKGGLSLMAATLLTGAFIALAVRFQESRE